MVFLLQSKGNAIFSGVLNNLTNHQCLKGLKELLETGK